MKTASHIRGATIAIVPSVKALVSLLWKLLGTVVVVASPVLVGVVSSLRSRGTHFACKCSAHSFGGAGGLSSSAGF